MDCRVWKLENPVFAYSWSNQWHTTKSGINPIYLSATCKIPAGLLRKKLNSFILLACDLKIGSCYHGHVPAFKGVHCFQHENFWRRIGAFRIVVQHGVSKKFLFFCCKTLLCLFFVVNQSSFISSSTFCIKTKHF